MFASLSMDLKRAMAINVRRERHARKLTEEELGDRAGLSARYLGSINEPRFQRVSPCWEGSPSLSARSLRANPRPPMIGRPRPGGVGGAPAV